MRCTVFAFNRRCTLRSVEMATDTLSVATSSNSSRYTAGSNCFSGLEEASIASCSQHVPIARRSRGE